MKPDPCKCTAYPFPHRLGGGHCTNESLDAPICGACRCHCSPKWVNTGIGPYEFWGATGNDVQMEWESDCCGAECYTDQTCKTLLGPPEEPDYD